MNLSRLNEVWPSAAAHSSVRAAAEPPPPPPLPPAPAPAPPPGEEDARARRNYDARQLDMLLAEIRHEQQTQKLLRRRRRPPGLLSSSSSSPPPARERLVKISNTADQWALLISVGVALLLLCAIVFSAISMCRQARVSAEVQQMNAQMTQITMAIISSRR